MCATVCKFGGSSLSDWKRFMRVADIIRSSPDRKYIIVSAPGKRFDNDEKITDLLFHACDAKANLRTIILSRVFQRYASIRDRLVPDFNLETEFRQIFNRIPLNRDYATSRGEYLCAKLFAAYTGLPFVDAAELFFFDENGSPDPARTMDAIRKHLLPLGCGVVPGFYGSNPDGSIRTFARGGSDISGAWIAAALQANLYENWTDVDGLYTADPRIVKEALRHKTISLYQMEQLGRAGANVLHPSALQPMKGTGIDTLLKNSFCPECAGTRITEDFYPTVPCVTGRKGFYLLPIKDCPSCYTPLLHHKPFAGALQVAAVNVFGLREDDVDTIQRETKPIHIIHMQNHLQIIIPEAQYEDTVRTVHKVLINRLQE